MSKKADMSINTIVAAALAIFLLLVLMFVFKNQIGNLAGGFFSAGNSAKAGINGTTCQTLIGGRVCNENIDKYNDYTKTQIPPSAGTKWSDCPSNICWELGVKK